jgi:hypothetical protein
MTTQRRRKFMQALAQLSDAEWSKVRQAEDRRRSLDVAAQQREIRDLSRRYREIRDRKEPAR